MLSASKRPLELPRLYMDVPIVTIVSLDDIDLASRVHLDGSRDRNGVVLEPHVRFLR